MIMKFSQNNSHLFFCHNDFFLNNNKLCSIKLILLSSIKIITLPTHHKLTITKVIIPIVKNIIVVETTILIENKTK